jgi:oligopeptide/dipeptide ABC transporter ATP-binding protein
MTKIGKEILWVRNLMTEFHLPEGTVPAVNDVSFHIRQGETLGVVGESGCGKSVTALSIMRLIPDPPGKIVRGEIIFEGVDLRRVNDQGIRKIRGNRMAMIFQEPMTSLNPLYSIGNQIAEVYTEHLGFSYKDAINNAILILRKVGIPFPEQRVHEYPHQLSGGMRQRAMIGMALVCNPKLLIADEPTTALDVTIQNQILNLMRNLQSETGAAIILITHNLGVIAEMADRVIVMYAGRIVEESDVDEIFDNPLHPYTQGLIGAIPVIGQKALLGKRKLMEIPGIVPDLQALPKGCLFHPRCYLAKSICKDNSPELCEKGKGHKVSCYLYSGS